ncbi:hypothetical protein [Microbacterium ulmi]|uniref:Uncharacterized protein n=1 Tax=Microbacterium ulmi TaxID=179095 RepID=A0A7Y2Q0C7_9MICO|nr:hypothetical protein [Microbacterium ulmi]NII68333.1 asparagine N-glycosylation enzyme membrane subunit Stt3 [Microbacterium ulmi]NNH03132.1 hypothetical protein [Microbacterium ulmi]
MTVVTSEQPGLAHPRIRRSFAAVRALLAVLLIVSIAAVAFAFVEQSHAELVNTVVWIRSVAVVAAAIILYLLAVFASRGRAGAYRRLRLLSFLIPAGVVLLIVAPGEFPLWIKIEQAVCGALILAVGIILSRRRLRELFPTAKKARRR